MEEITREPPAKRSNPAWVPPVEMRDQRPVLF